MNKTRWLKVLLPTVFLVTYAAPIRADAASVSPPSGLVSWWKAENNAMSVSEVAILSGTVPDAFSFIDQTGAALGAQVESNTITVTAITSPSPITIVGGDYAISADGGGTWGGWTSAAGTVSLNNQVKVRQTSSASYSTLTTATLTIGGVNGAFNVTTMTTALLPIPVTGLRVWLKADTGIAKDGSNRISSWADQSGNGFHVAQGGSSKQPLFVDGAISGKPVIRFDGADDYLQTPGAVNLINGTGNYTLFVVVKPGPTQKAWADIMDYTHSTDVNTVVQQDGNATNHFGGFGNVFEPLSSEAYQIYSNVYAANTSISVYLNGGNRLHQTGIATTFWSEPNYFTVGSKSLEAYPRQFNGDIAEVIVYDIAASDAERQAVESYLITKYGLDLTPEAFSFTAQTGVPLSSLVESNVITVTGINSPTEISIVGGDYAISTNDGAAWGGWTHAPGIVSLNNQVKVRLTSSAVYSTLTTATLTIGGVSGTFSVTTVTPPAAIHLDKTTLRFGSQAGATTGVQTVMISNSGGGTLNWTRTPSAAWITATPGSGTGAATVTIGANTTGLAAGTYSGTVAFTDPAATNSPQNVTVNLTVYAPAGTQAPFGDFATPINGTTGVVGAIPVTGWALDDVEVTKIEIWRDPVLSAGEVNSRYFVGFAIFVEGLRPDVEALYTEYPLNYRGGWGYMLLTNFLPNHGNGTYVLYALAFDADGHTIELGAKTITCDNANAVKPFGTIDTPAQGGTVSGTFYNFGWVLTPLPGTVPKDGHLITVFVDAVLRGNLSTPPNVYNAYRPDVSNNFPGLNNTGGPGAGEGGPVGAFNLNTTGFANGVHSIFWIAYDDMGRGEGIGSRFFTIANTGGSPEPAPALEAGEAVDSKLSLVPVSLGPVMVKTGFDLNAEFAPRLPDADGILRIEIPEINRVEIELGGEETEAGALRPSRTTHYRGYMVFGNEFRPLPVGSALDRRTGRFSWMPGPGFLGTYDLVFVEGNAANPSRSFRVRVEITPKR